MTTKKVKYNSPEKELEAALADLRRAREQLAEATIAEEEAVGRVKFAREMVDLLRKSSDSSKGAK